MLHMQPINVLKRVMFVSVKLLRTYRRYGVKPMIVLRLQRRLIQYDPRELTQRYENGSYFYL